MQTEEQLLRDTEVRWGFPRQEGDKEGGGQRAVGQPPSRYKRRHSGSGVPIVANPHEGLLGSYNAEQRTSV